MINEYNFRTVSLIDCYNPNNKDLEVISKKTGLNSRILQGGLDFDARPKIIRRENYGLVFFSAPIKEDNEIKTTTFSMFFSRKNIIIFRNTEITAMNKIKEYDESVKTPLLLYLFLDHVLNDFFQIMDDLDEQIDKLEDEIVLNPNKSAIQKIFFLKKQLIFFHKAFSANREVLILMSKVSPEFTKLDAERFQELYDRIIQLIDLEGIYRDILTNNLDMYLSSVSNNMNKTVRRLTFITTVFMPLTLLAGIGGMSEWSMMTGPQNWKIAYPLFLIAMAVIGIASYFVLRKAEKKQYGFG